MIVKITTKNENLSGEVYPVYEKFYDQTPHGMRIELESVYGQSSVIKNRRRMGVRWPIPKDTNRESLKKLFADADFLNNCEQIIEGFRDDWSDSGWSAHFNEEAKQAIRRAKRIIENIIPG